MSDAMKYTTVGGKAIRPSRYAPKTCPHCGQDPYLGILPGTDTMSQFYALQLYPAGLCLKCKKDPLHEAKASETSPPDPEPA